MVVHTDMTTPHGVTFWTRVEAMLPRHASGAVIVPQREPPKGKRPFHPWCRFSDYRMYGVFGIGFGTKLPRYHKLKFCAMVISGLMFSEWLRRQMVRRSLIYNPTSWTLNPDVFWAYDTKPPIDWENDEDLREHCRNTSTVDPDTLIGLLNMSHRPMGGGVANYATMRPKVLHIPGEEKTFPLNDTPLARLFRWWRVTAVDELGVARHTRLDEYEGKKFLNRQWQNNDIQRDPLYDDTKVIHPPKRF